MGAKVQLLIAIKDKAKEMRALQVEFFTQGRSRDVMFASKKSEKELDKLIAQYDNPAKTLF